MPVKNFELCWNRVTDLAPLKRMPLYSLNCGWCQIPNLRRWRHTGVKELFILGGQKIGDISPIRNLPLVRISLNFKADLMQRFFTNEDFNDHQQQTVANSGTIIRRRKTSCQLVKCCAADSLRHNASNVTIPRQ